MMRKVLLVLALCWRLDPTAYADAQTNPDALRAGQNRESGASVTGNWLAQTRDGVFRIAPCGDALCGQLVGMDYDGPIPHDVTGRSQCNLTMLTGFRRSDDARWQGKIYDPEGGKTYDALIWTAGANTLKLRGYVLDVPLFGRTQTWTRFTGQIGKDCKMIK